ncbi:MAG TPA: hypothetical protein ENG98_00555 [Actinobacteria bacterium]|nr:hypothetical protein BMS3Bbin02_01309 [bacterium BMS3Bbin02]HDL41485.1 hypothetical protein [Actinomycetota bacterium]
MLLFKEGYDTPGIALNSSAFQFTTDCPRRRGSMAPMRRLLSLALAPLVVLAACAIGTPVGDTTVKFVAERPAQIDWTRTVAGYPISGSGRTINLDELDLVTSGFGLIPQALLDKASPEALFRVADGDEVSSLASAYSKGFDIYLIDHTFEVADTAVVMQSILAHELVHVAQFAGLVDESQATDFVPRDNAIGGSALVRDFASAVGWSSYIEGDTLIWTLADPRGATEYGRSDPVEDMADSVAAVITGAEDSISRSRVDWILNWLGSDLATLTRGAPWIPANAENSTSTDPLFSVELARRSGIIDPSPTYYVWDINSTSIEHLAGLVRQGLATHGWTGSFTSIDDPSIPRVAGLFSIGARTMWVELWDFPRGENISGGPDRPLLAYVVNG